MWLEVPLGDTGEGASVTRRLPAQVLVQLCCVGLGLLGCGRRGIGGARSSLLEVSIEGSLDHLSNGTEGVLSSGTLCKISERAVCVGWIVILCIFS